MSELIDRSARVSTLELFFDLVFVFTITQLTGVLVAGGDAAQRAAGRRDARGDLVDVRRLCVADERDRDRPAAVPAPAPRRDGRRSSSIALAIPSAYESTGLAFGLGYAVVVVLHAGMYVKGTSVSEVAAILRIVPFNLTAAALVLVGGARGRSAAGRPLGRRGAPALVHAVVHEHRGLRDRRGALLRAARARDHRRARRVDRRRRRRRGRRPARSSARVVALLALALSAALWWLYFRDEDGGRARDEGGVGRTARTLALVGFGYWHYGLLLGVVAIAAGLKKAVGDPYDPLAGWIGMELGVGVALFAACTVGFRTTLGLGVSRSRLVAAAAALATIPLGTEWSAAGQLAALTAIVVAALVGRGEAAAVEFAASPRGSTPRS